MICYCSKNYRGSSNAGNKARLDLESIFESRGFMNIGNKTTHHSGAVFSFILTIVSILRALTRLKRGDTLLLQYPQNKFYTPQCKIARIKGANTITFIHDLKSFRRKKVTLEQEIVILSRSSCIVAHNDTMKSWLEDNGIATSVISLGIFDYLSKNQAVDLGYSADNIRVVFAGALSRRKCSFLYDIGRYVTNYKLSLYGNSFDLKLTPNYVYNGFVPSDQLIATVDGDYGLVWDGDSLDECCGAFGEYLKINNPHKTSLYIRCELPIIIWKRAALATFVEDNNIGIAIDNLKELDTLLPNISREEYLEMKRNVVEMSEKLRTGHFVTTAIETANALISKP